MVRGHAQAAQKREKGVAGRAICWQHSRHDTDITPGNARATQMQCREEDGGDEEGRPTLRLWIFEIGLASIFIFEGTVSALLLVGSGEVEGGEGESLTWPGVSGDIPPTRQHPHHCRPHRALAPIFVK